MTDDTELIAALEAIQARGAIGEASLDRAVAHARQYARCVPADALTLVDLGSGGGLPGLVIAIDRPVLRLTLVERRHTRADLLRRAVVALGLADRVVVLAEDVKALAARSPRSFDVVTARSFAAPQITARWAAALLRPGGLLIVSEPPEDDADRWPSTVLAAVGLVDEGRNAQDQGVRCLRRV